MKKDLCLRQASPIPFFTRFLLLLVMASLLTSCGSNRIIVNGLDEKEANEILVYLATKGINATKIQAATDTAGGAKTTLWNISVEESKANEAMALLNQVGLPRRRGQNLLGIFANSGLVPSGLQEKIRYQAGLAEQIASIIRKIDGVLDAEVQISFPDEDPLNPGANKQKITASVFVKHSGILDDPNAHLATRIKRLVAGSVNGLDFDNVTVIGDRARFTETAPGGFQGGFSEDERPYVNVWSVVVARDSLTRFQTIFFSFTVALLLLLSTLLWLLWKLLPILKATGGFKQLLSLQPIQTENLGIDQPKTKVEEAIKKDEDDESESDVT
jgi:type III secretion protein J